MSNKRKRESDYNDDYSKKRRLYKTKKLVKKKRRENLKKDFVDFERVKSIRKIIEEIENPSFTLPVLLSIIMFETYKNNKLFKENLTNEELLKELKIVYPFFFSPTKQT